MKQQREFDNSIIRSGTRIRESVRSLPKGHFQQIRQMFDKSTTYSARKLSTIYERQPKSVLSDVLLRLPVTDDEKLKHATTNNNNNKSLEERYRDYLAEYQAFRQKLTDELNQHKSMYPSKSLEQSISLPPENNLTKEILISTTSLPLQLNKQRQLAMSAAVNYTDSYDSLSSNPLKRSGSTRQYASSLNNALDTQTKSNSLKPNQQLITNETFNTLQPSRRLHSSTSLSSTGYDSNSSPSIKSKRNSIATNNSNDFIIPSNYSLSSSSSSSSSSDELQQKPSSKPWIQNQTNTINPSFYTSIFNENAFESSTASSPLISRTEIKLNQPTIETRPVTTVRHATARSSGVNDSPSSSSSPTSIHEPIIKKQPTNNSSYILQTTSFPDKTDGKVDKKVRRWNNIHTDRVEIINPINRQRRSPLMPTNSTGFQVINLNNDQTQFSIFTPIPEQKSINEREIETPLPTAENPVFEKLPPKKPPRTFQHETQYDQLKKVPSSSSSTNTSPSFDLGARSVSCMNLTAGVSDALLSSGLLPLEHTRPSRRSSNTSDKIPKKPLPNENIYEELKTPTATINKKDNNQQFLFNSSQAESKKTDVILRTPTTKSKATYPIPTGIKSAMKKGVSEPDLAKRSRSKSPFSPRGLIDRFKRMLPLTLSRQALNQNDSIPPNDSDDSASTSSENNDNLRTSRLDHVSRVRNIYESLSTTNMSGLFTDPNFRTSISEIKTLYDYVVHILPEQDLGYFSNGNGCLSSSNINLQQPISSSSSIRFKYPLNANDEATLKYFCFPDQHDSNNNPIILTKRTSQEYFRFTLTNMHGIRQYGYCSRFFHKGVLNALCIVSPCDAVEIYEKILSTATELFLSYKEDYARKFFEEIYVHRLPNRGDTIHIQTSTVGLYTLKCELDRRKDLMDSITLLSLSTETIIKIFSSILYEQKIIFIGNDVGPLTRLINTFICLLYPFSWPHTYVPILPALMLDIIQAPTPYIIGILRSCEPYLTANDDLNSQDSSDILIVDIDHDRVRSLNEYLNRSNYFGSTENLHTLTPSNSDNGRFQILPKIFKIELKQEISLLRKNKISLSLDECQQRLRDVFMSIFVQSCYNYKDYFNGNFQREEFVQSKQHTIELFLEWFTRTQLFELFIRQKFESENSQQFAITFDLACEKHCQTLNKQTPQRITAKSVKRKSATRANKQDNRF